MEVGEARDLREDKSLVESAVNVWASVDLPKLQVDLDERGVAIQEYQKESLVSRKELATKTKSFKKLEDEEKLEQFTPLLKAYQNEIDNLNKRTKSIETTFFKVYRALAEVPDPKPLLKNALMNSQSQQELQKIKEENVELSKQLLKYADYNTLKDKISQTEKDMEKLSETKVKAIEDKWKSVLEEKESNWSKTELKMQTSIEGLKTQLEESSINEKMLKRKLKNHELAFADESTNATGEDVNFKETVIGDDSIEVNLLKKDLESAQSRIGVLENRNEELRKEVSAAKSKSEMDIEKFKQSERNELSALESENAMVVARLEHERKTVTNLKNEINTIRSNSETQIEQLNNEIASLNIIKNETSDYQDIKKELEIIKLIQFGDDEEDNETGKQVGAGSANVKPNNNGEEKSLIDGVDGIESAIVQRNRKLNDEVVKLRNKNEEFSKELTVSKNQINDLTDKLKKLQDSNSRLETDLLNFDSSTSKGNDQWETMSMISSYTSSQYPKTSGKVSPAASIAGGISDNASVILGNQQDSSLLPIITQQRDRFRSRNRELEEENKKNFSRIMEMKKQVNSLKTDNKELYEKIQFLKFHNNSTNTSNVSANNIDERYAKDYERQLHPIEKFRILETQRISSKISPWERVFIQITRTVLSTPYTRWLFAGYCILLHLVVMLLTLTLVGSSPQPIIAPSTLTSSTGGKAV